MNNKSILFLGLVFLFCTSFTLYRSSSSTTHNGDESKVEVKYFMRKIDGHLYLTTVAVGVQTTTRNYSSGTNVSVCTVHAASCPCHNHNNSQEEKNTDNPWHNFPN